MRLKTLLAGFLLTLPMACGTMNASPQSDLPAMRWDHRPEAEVWTERTLMALEDHGAALADLVPGDIDTWCPGYKTADRADRMTFWAGMFSSLAKHESTWNPKAAGGGGKWIGLTQIDPRSARYYGCEATTVAELKNGAANLSCAVRIAAIQVPKDNMVAGNGTKGLGRDWGPFRNERKRADMAAWIRTQSYCQG